MDAANGVTQEQADGAVESTETVIAATEAPDRFPEMVDRALGGERFQVTRYGKPKVAVLKWDDYLALRDLERKADPAA